MSLWLNSIGKRSDPASLTFDNITTANRSVTHKAVKASWMDARRSCPDSLPKGGSDLSGATVSTQLPK